MALRRGRKGNLGLEVLSLIELALPEPDGQTLLRDRHGETVAAISDALASSLDNVSRLQGWQVQYAFEAVVVALGNVRLIKFEDSGIYYFDDADGELQPPDFRIVLRDGSQLLVEVKNVAPNATTATVRAKDLSAAQRYADATGGRLLYAHFWSHTGLWTLVDPSAFDSTGSLRRLTLGESMKANEMYLLGDSWLAVEPPLVLSVITDRDKEQVVERHSGTADTRRITVRRMELLNAGRLITDSAEWKLAWFLIWNGHWAPTENLQFDKNGRLERINYVFSPDIPDEVAARQIAARGMAIVGALSTLSTRRFLEVTTTNEGDIRALREEPEPALLVQLIPDDYWNRQDRALSLWKLNVSP
ncbi:hypothetical protein [Amycolatopsis solani]|uniref:hypothetical protein n=1 Tax=Amycolatopsis solani TaxID=3028615 RepID=UPI0025B015AB|nr:hypothetical protein [Amycolatopsis sp. MEP2-6]